MEDLRDEGQMQAESDLLLLKGLIFDMDKPTQDRVQECLGKFRELIKEYGDDGILAVTWLGLEMQARIEAEEKANG